MNDTIKVRIRGLYKVFGVDPEKGLERIKIGTGKQELLREYGQVLGLENINIDVYSGKITVIMGLSGSGKSTLIRHVNRLIEPTSGEIIIDGEDIMKLNPVEVRELRRTKMSMVFQNFALLPHQNVLKNTCLAPSIRGISWGEVEKDARRWLNRVGLKGHDNQFPGELSGGMQQRVGIARALTSNSEMMLMDEAFSALDPLIRSDMQDLLLELQRELHKTVVFITHDLDEALKLADHLVILKDGAVVQQGDPQDILLNPIDPYIEDFVSDINRARVLRVRSVMSDVGEGDNVCQGEVSPEDNLESLIALSGGDTSCTYRVVDEGNVVGEIEIADLVRSLVPRRSSQPGAVGVQDSHSA